MLFAEAGPRPAVRLRTAMLQSYRAASRMSLAAGRA